MKLGVLTMQDAPWMELVRRWQTLDELGVDTIWVADHLGGDWLRPGRPWFEAWTTLGALSQLTRNARIGTLVSPMTFRNPAVLARAALTVAEISAGRLELGVGAGGAAADHELAQVERWAPKARAARFEAWLERLLELLADERFHPKRSVPLTVAGRGPTMLRLAALYADRWNTYAGIGLTPREAARRSREDNARLDELCAGTGRSVLRSALIGFPFVGETPWASDDAFADVVGRWEDAGFEELVFYYPPEWGMPAGSVTPGVFESAVTKG